MEITFSDHALKQIAERKLSRNEIETAIKNPEKIFKQSMARYRAVRSFEKAGKRYLLVAIYDEMDLVKEVVTAFLTRKFKKYL